MSKRKPGRPAALPVESPHWIPYATALQQATERFGSKRLAIAKLDAALASDTIRCKIERVEAAPELVQRGDQVAAVFLPFELQNDPAEEGPTIFVNRKSRAGWLFMWNYDLIKYFGGTVAAVPAAKARVQEIAAAVGRPPEHDWPKIEKIAARIYLKYPDITRTALIELVQDRLEDAGKKAPALSALQPLVNRVVAASKKS